MLLLRRENLNEVEKYILPICHTPIFHPMPRLNQYDTIVVGVGGMGSSTCYQLAKQGFRVLGLEQFDIPHTKGSSHGYTRIIRLAYYEDIAYVPLLRQAYHLWNELEELYGHQIFYKTGSVDIGTTDSLVFSGSYDSCLKHDIPHEVLTGSELNYRFPGYAVPEDFRALYQPDGGFLLPQSATVAFVEAAQQFGADIRAREKLLDWTATNNGVRVTTNKAVYEADSLVFTGGAWNQSLLPTLAGLAIPERQVLAWLQPKQPGLFTPQYFPVFNIQLEAERYYGFPVFGIPGFKFGKYHHLRESGTPESFDWEPSLDDEKILRAFAAKIFPKGNGATMSLKTCMFTNSPDEHFIIDLHPDFPQVSFAAGFSGHGYKFASVIGKIMADLATKRQTELSIELFRLGRFTKKN